MAKSAKKPAEKKAAKMQVLNATEAREANGAGTLPDREVFELSFPGHPTFSFKKGKETVEFPTLVGYGAFVRGQLFTRQCELRSPDNEEYVAGRKAEQLASLEKFLPTVEDPE